MKSNYVPLLAILLIIVIFISGCVSNQTTQSEQTMSAETSDCTSPYDGTYSGLVSGSGEVSHLDCSGDGLCKNYETPYIITYSLEVTFKCKGFGPDPDHNNQLYWHLDITHAKVSDPFFGCVNGCTPLQTLYVEFSKPGERGVWGGQLLIDFPNGADIWVDPISTDPDAKRISADQLDPENVIKYSSLGEKPANLENIEDRFTKCSDCLGTFEQQGFTMTLDKIS